MNRNMHQLQSCISITWYDQIYPPFGSSSSKWPNRIYKYVLSNRTYECNVGYIPSGLALCKQDPSDFKPEVVSTIK